MNLFFFNFLNQTYERPTPINRRRRSLNFFLDNALLERIVIEHVEQILFAHFQALKALSILHDCANDGLQFGKVLRIYCFLQFFLKT